MQIKVEIMSAERTSPTVGLGEYVPCPIRLNGPELAKLRDDMAQAAWSLTKTYNLSNSKRECRSVVFSFIFDSITGKPACVKE